MNELKNRGVADILIAVVDSLRGFPEANNAALPETIALNSKLRRTVRTRGHFPGDRAAMKPPYLVLDTAAQEWKRPPCEWFQAKTQLAVISVERFVI